MSLVTQMFHLLASAPFPFFFDNVLHMHYVFLNKKTRLSRTLFDRRIDDDG
jgi:hypothetical protein